MAVLLTQADILNSYATLMLWKYCYTVPVSAYESISFSELLQYLVKVILFKVKVPVLSEQIVLAPPIVSHAYIFLTKLLSTSIFLTEKAKDNVTAKGNP